MLQQQMLHSFAALALLFLKTTISASFACLSPGVLRPAVMRAWSCWVSLATISGCLALRLFASAMSVLRS